MSREWKTYTCRYYHKGAWWGLHITASDNEDAEERARKLGSLQILGELKGVIPAFPGAGIFVRMMVAARNFFQPRRAITSSTDQT